MNRLKGIIWNIIQVAGSNLLTAVVSILITLILPKVLNVQNYGMYQIYALYITYVPYLCFGWPDGILLRYGGESYEKLDYRMYKAQWVLYLFFVYGIGISIIAVSLYMRINNVNRWIIFLCAGISALIDLPKIYLRYILQTTNKIKQYVLPMVMEKAGVVIMFGFCCLLGAESYIIFIFVDLMGKMISLICSLVVCREITFAKAWKYQIALSEAKENIYVGIKLMLTNVASMLIVGCVRIAIERQWDVETFGKISLTLSISNMLMIFIRAVGLVIFPILRCVKEENHSDIYNAMRTLLMVMLLGMLGLYYPMRELLNSWLPQYIAGLNYMAILFPMCVFESKMSMVIEPCIKARREEKTLLVINVTTVIMSICFSWITSLWLNNLDLTVVIIIFLLAFRCICSELFITRKIGLNKKNSIVAELLVTIVFCLTGWFVTSLYGVLLYLVMYAAYLLYERREIKQTFIWIKKYNMQGE